MGYLCGTYEDDDSDDDSNARGITPDIENKSDQPGSSHLFSTEDSVPTKCGVVVLHAILLYAHLCLFAFVSFLFRCIFFSSKIFF